MCYGISGPAPIIHIVTISVHIMRQRLTRHRGGDVPCPQGSLRKPFPVQIFDPIRYKIRTDHRFRHAQHWPGIRLLPETGGDPILVSGLDVR